MMWDAPFLNPGWGVRIVSGTSAEVFARAFTELGVTQARIGLNWEAVEPVKGQPYRWSTDKNVDRSEAAGLKMLGVIARGPAWAAGENWPGEDLPSYLDVCEAVATRYRGRVQAYEIWNEPHLHGFTPDQYRAMLVGAYPRIKAGDPDAAVVGFALNGTPSEPLQADKTAWFRTLIADPKVRASMDALSWHVYSGKQPPEFGDQRGSIDVRMQSSLAMLAEYGWTKPTVVSEGGYTTDEGPGWAVSEADQTRFNVRLAIICMSYVPTYFHFEYTAKGSGGFGLLRKDDTQGSAAIAFQTMARILNCRTFGVYPVPNPKVRIYRFERSGMLPGFVLWTATGSAGHRLDGLTQNVRVTSMMGQSSLVGTTLGSLKVNVTQDPTYVEQLA